MTKTKNNSRHMALKVGAIMLCPLTFAGGIYFSNFADAESVSYVRDYNQSVSITNASFTSGATPYAEGNSLSGWNAIETQSTARGMIINVGSEDTSSSSSTTFSKYQSEYGLLENPYASGSDSRILMINSKTKSGTSQQANKGYRSTSITLNANSYYKFSVAVKTALNGDDNVNASLYISGLKDKDGKAIPMGYENLTNTNWKEFCFFIATGDSEQTINIDLYLGSANGARSNGAVFFDDVKGVRYSQNAFFEECYYYGYNGNDNYQTYLNNNERGLFLVDNLLSEKNFVVNSTDYNFDFEKDIEADSNTLGDEWEIISASSGHGVIQDIANMQPADFKKLTGYSYIGNDLSYQNEQALLLYTGNKDENGNMQNSEGYVGVRSESININAHQIYKITLKLKCANISQGNFYLKVQEDDKIYDTYSALLSSDKESKKYYALKDGKTSAISSNVTNNWTNDYQTVEMYVKGHSLYNSAISLELWLGDESSNANGCVAIDNITVEYASYESYQSASNKLELTSFTSSPDTITNGFFNQTENEGEGEEYPLKATGWTTYSQSEQNDSGVIYLHNQETYNSMYRSQYEWAGIYPNNPVGMTESTPNNVYMMRNASNSYQYIESGTYQISANNYYKLSFDFYTQNASSLNDSTLRVDIIDENGILLFTKSGISSLDSWSTMEVLLRTSEAVSHNIKVRIYLGDENHNVGGLAYIDNVIVSADSSSDNSIATAFKTATNKTDLTSFYTNISENGKVTNEITNASAYTLDVDAIYNSSYTDQDKDLCAKGGIISGSDNPYGVINSDLILTDENNYLVINTKVACEAKLTSKFNLNFESDKFYKLTFSLATIFDETALNAKTDEHDCKYGVSILIDGYQAVTGLVTLNELKDYSIIYQSTSSSTPTLTVKLVSDCNDTIGTALLTKLDVTTVDESEYNKASTLPAYNDTLFTSKATSATSDEDNNSDEENQNETTNNASSNLWILIPSIITGLAVVIGVIGYILRHIKIKKIEKIRKETYDKRMAVNHDAIVAEAQKRRDAELKNLQMAVKTLENDKFNLEEEHKKFVKECREKDGEKISKEMEKAFKVYNNNINRLNEKINILNEKIEYTISAEYLISIQKKIALEEEDKFKAERKSAKKQQKMSSKDMKD